MSEGWAEKLVGDVCTLQRGFDLPKRLRESGRFPLVSSSGIIDTHIEAKVSGPGVVTGRSGSIGNVFYVDDDFWPLNTCLYVKDFHGNDPEFICYFLKQFDLGRFASGAGVPTLNRNTVHVELVRFPESLAEQKRIVSILDEAFGAIERAKENAQKNLANARELFESYLNALLLGKSVRQRGSPEDTEGMLREVDELRRKAVENGIAKKVKPGWIMPQVNGKIPSHWAWVQLDRLASGISDGVHKKPTYVDEGVPFITIKNLTCGTGISFEDVKYITRKDHEEYIKRTHPEKGDILITKDGTIGVVRLIECNDEFSIFVSVALVKPLLKRMSRYLNYALQSSLIQGQIIPQGTALKHLYLTDLRRMAIPIPPLEEQESIVQQLDFFACESKRLEGVCESKLTALDELKQSILQKAFTGQLTAKSPELEAVG